MQQVPTSGRDVFIRYKTNAASAGPLVIHDNCSNRMARAPAMVSFKFLPYQLSMVGYWPTMVANG